MEELDIAFLKNRFCNEISGGELQLAYIAKALVCKPRILILDEPESNLDFYNQGRVLKTLKKLSRQNKTTIIINSHHIQNMLIIADKGCAKKMCNRFNYRLHTLMTSDYQLPDFIFPSLKRHL